MKNPFRFWMTGGAAMILAALSGARALAEERPATTRISRYGVEETVSRITASAQRHGLPVLARLQQNAAEEGRESRLVIVLESSQGGTPVSMDAADAQPSLLLSVVVQRGAGGATEVLLLQGSLDDLPEGMSEAVRQDLEDLPLVVDEALAA
jgi:hypothetical protein